MGSWPVIARPERVDPLVSALTARPARAQMLRGPSGVGKTTIAASVSRAIAAQGRTIVPLIALQELRQVPLGALAPLLAASRFRAEDDVSARLQELMSLVGRQADSYLLVVDDAPLLDDASAAALYQLVRVFAVPCLLTARDEHAISGPIARLLHEDLVTVTEVPGLDLDQTRELLRRHLGADPRPESLQRLFDTTRGNPLFVRELVQAAERADRVRPGPFGIEVEPARLPDHILETVAGRLGDLRADERALGELLAVAQPWPIAAVRDAERDTLDDLVGAGIVTTSGPEESGYLQLAHPVYAEALLSVLDPEARSGRRREAAARLTELGEPQLRFTALCLLDEAGDDLPVDELVWAAGYAHAAGDHQRAARVARRALALVDDQPAAPARISPEESAPANAALAHSAPAHLVLASALSALGEADDAEASFAAADAAAATDLRMRATVHLRWGQHTALRRSAPRAAVDRMTAVLDELDDAGRALLAPDLAKWRLMAGDTDAVPALGKDAPTPAPAPAPAPASGPADPASDPAALNAALGAAMIATMSGRTREAAAAVEAGRPLAAQHADVLPFAGSLLDLSQFLVDVGDGRIAEARAFVEERRLAPFADSAGLWSYALALIHLHSGRLNDALPMALLAVDQLRWRDFTGLLGSALALGATVHAQLGDAAAAEALLDQLDDAHRDDVKVVLQSAEARAWIAVGRDDTATALAEIGAAVQRGAELGHLLLTALTATVSLRLGVAHPLTEPLVGMAEYAASPLIALVARAAAAIDNRDARAAVEFAPALQRAGLDALALDLVTQAREWAGGERMLERRARVLAAELSLTVVTPQRLRSPRDEAGLTEREWVIAQAAAQRQRSKEIADRLGVSVRTVDNHLASVYRKLGVSGRAELEKELRGHL